MRVGPLILPIHAWPQARHLFPAFRHPVVLAKDVPALDEITGGRFTLGIGAGSSERL